MFIEELNKAFVAVRLDFGTRCSIPTKGSTNLNSVSLRAGPPMGLSVLGSSLLVALENKLSRIASTVKSVEFNRQCLLAKHNLRTISHEIKSKGVRIAQLLIPVSSTSSAPNSSFSYFEADFFPSMVRCWYGLRPVGFAAYPLNAPSRRVPLEPMETELYVNLDVPLPERSPYARLTYEMDLRFFQYFSSLIDRVAEYWREIVNAREAFKEFSIGTRLRQHLRSALKFKPLHTPVEIVPRSIHPIELAA
jgi:hypothetical protein